MFRRIALFSSLFCVTLAGFASDAQAGCGRGGRYSFRPTVRYSRPHVQTIVHQPVVRKIVQPVTPKVVVAPRPAKPQLPTVPAGSTLTLPANFLGNQPGDVFMVFNKIKLPMKVQRWTQTGVTITLPPMAIKTAVEIRVDIVLPNGALAVSRQIRVTKPASVVLHPTAPTSPLPTEAAIQQQNGPQPQVGPTQPVAIAPSLPQPQPGQPQVVQPQVGQPIILSNGPLPSSPQQENETNPILEEHANPPVEVDSPDSSTQPAPSNNPLAAISKLIGG